MPKRNSPRTAAPATSSETETRGIRVLVRSTFRPERSSTADDSYFFSYRIRIVNESGEIARLLAREWVITDALGHVEMVQGEGVVGEQPVLQPGEAFEYESYCPLATPTGSMEGKYMMVTATGELFQARIAPFALSAATRVN